MAYEAWTYNTGILIDNTGGSYLTGYQHKIILTSDNFDFTLADPDGADIRFAYGETLLDYWIESYDSTAEYAVIWVALSIGAEEKIIQIYYGNVSAVDESDGDAVFEYFNALETSGDIADLSSSFGTSTWTVASDASAPNGLCTNISIGTANDAGKYKSLSLPSAYVVECMQKQTSDNGSWHGPLMQMEDADTWYRPGTDTNATSNGVQIRKDDGGSKTNYPSNVKSGCLIGLSTWYKLKAYFKAYSGLTGSTDFSTRAATLQGIAWNDADSEIVVAYSNGISRYNTSGVELEYTSSVPSGTSWGDIHIKDNKIYVVMFDDTTATYVYSFADDDLASGYTLEATLTGDMDSGADGITFDGTYWIIGETSTSSTNIHLYVYDTSWVLQATVIISRPGGENYGIQGLEYVDGLLHVANHYGRNQVFTWDNVTFDAILVDYWKTGQDDYSQAMAWDPTNSRWYVLDRANNKVLFRTLAEGSDNIVFAEFRTDDKSHAMAYHLPTTAFTQVYFGFGAYRSCYVAQLFVRQHVNIVPSITVNPQVVCSISLESGAYPASSTIEIAAYVSGATIYYTTDGTTPTTSSSVYSSAIPMFTGTLKAYAVASGYDDSNIVSANYAILSSDNNQPIVFIIM
ncbi:DUF2341 domain-containing protein [Desulfobacter vibrioformis]|uniref:DUF2341 domain-containing protein n=1 Tax=Desulfobacter vibrioformis TaxID=34031 RepID=UPI00054FD473|nr:DUF2341 domain-containing protein [Desulfobacter vibrioformis]